MKKFLIPSTLVLAASLLCFLACQKQADTQLSTIEQAPVTESTGMDWVVEDRASCSTTTCTGSVVVAGICPKYRNPSNSGLPSLYTMLLSKGWVVCGPPVKHSSSTFSECVQWRMSATGTVSKIKFSDFGELRAILGIPTGNTDQAHHIIPKQLCDAFSSGSQLHPVVEAAAFDGFHPNDAYNGIRLTTTNHSGSHPRYTDWVNFQLTSYQNASGYSSKTIRQINTWVQCKLIPAALTHINNAVAQGIKVQDYFVQTFPGQGPTAFPTSVFIGT